MATEYNASQHSNTTSANLYEEDVNFLPDPHGVGSRTAQGTMNSTTTIPLTSPPSSSTSSKVPNGFAFSFNPHSNNNNKIANSNPPLHHQQQQSRLDNTTIPNQAFAYPLAHSPVSQVQSLCTISTCITRFMN